LIFIAFETSLVAFLHFDKILQTFQSQICILFDTQFLFKVEKLSTFFHIDLLFQTKMWSISGLEFSTNENKGKGEREVWEKKVKKNYKDRRKQSEKKLVIG